VRGEREQAGELEDLQKAAELSQRKDVEVLVSLAECQARKKQWEQATTTAREALKLRPEDEALASLVQRLAERK
jgi:Flp pilus assembly protein TadD